MFHSFRAVRSENSKRVCAECGEQIGLYFSYCKTCQQCAKCHCAAGND